MTSASQSSTSPMMGISGTFLRARALAMRIGMYGGGAPRQGLVRRRFRITNGTVAIAASCFAKGGRTMRMKVGVALLTLTALCLCHGSGLAGKGEKGKDKVVTTDSGLKYID